MIHYSDIHDALARRDTSDLEDAFRAFVGFPNEDEVEEIDTLDNLMRTFASVCEALRGDERIMPSATADVLEEVSDLFEFRHFYRTYSGGAGLVLTLLSHFRTRAAQHFKGGLS